MRFSSALLLTVLASFVLCFGTFAAPGRAFAEPPKEPWPAHLRLLAGPNGGQWFVLGNAMSEILSRHVLPSTSRMGGGVNNIKDIGQKTGDIGFTLTCFLGAAESGVEEYSHIKLDNTVLLAKVYPQVLYFLVRKDFAQTHNITSVESLLQKKTPLRFASLKPGTASEFIVNMLFKYGYGTSFEQLREQGWIISFNDYAETADSFVAEELDCFAYTAGTTVPLIKTMEEHTEVIILPLEKHVLDRLSTRFKTGTYTVEPGDYKSITSPVLTLGDYTALIVRKDLPDDLVFAVAKTLWEGKAELSKIIKDFGSLSPNTALSGDLPAHPGALRFWNG